MEMKKMVLQVTIDDENRKRKALKVVAAVEGVDSVTVDMKIKKIPVIGLADPLFVTARLRKYGFGFAELLSVGAAKEEKKEEKNLENPTVRGEDSVVVHPNFTPLKIVRGNFESLQKFYE